MHNADRRALQAVLQQRWLNKDLSKDQRLAGAVESVAAGAIGADGAAAVAGAMPRVSPEDAVTGVVEALTAA